jgi:glutamine amidotransferase
VNAAEASPVARIGIVDYGMGNLRSVEKALARVGAAAEISRDRDRLAAADGLVLPGVGAFPAAMRAVREHGLDEVVRGRAAAGVPVLGICLGMQLLFERSDELGGADGIALIEGSVEQIGGPGLKLPQIGWNAVRWRRTGTLNDGLPDPCAFYHVHSYAPRPAADGDVLGLASYGGDFASAVERGRIAGVQFHPEKSGPAGLALLGNFARACARAPAPARS